MATPSATDTATSTIAATPTPTATMVPTATLSLAPTPTPTPVTNPPGGTLSAPAAVRFGAIGVGMSPETKTVLIRNRSSVSALALELGNLAAPFAVTGTGTYSVPPDSSVSVSIALTPATVGSFTQSLAISSGDPKHPQASITISATVEPGRLSAPHSVALVAKPGATVTKTVVLRNSGKGMLSGTVAVMDPGSALTLMGGPVTFTLAPHAIQPITIQFAPASTGVISANLAINTTPPPAAMTMVVTGSAR
jgi:hypothetical protein